MSLIFAALPRSERLLPVESESTIRRATRCRVLFLSADKNPGLYEHVAFYTEAEQLTRRRQRRWAHAVGSVKVPVRCRGFLPCTLSSSTQEDMKEDDVKTITSRTQTTSSTSEVTPWLPRLTMLRLCTTLLAPYETLLCPNLLCSPLLPPMLEACTTQLDNSKCVTESAVAGGAMAETVTNIARLSAEAAVPVQEALLFFSLCLVYFELAIPSAHPCCWDISRCEPSQHSSTSIAVPTVDGADAWLTCNTTFNKDISATGNSEGAASDTTNASSTATSTQPTMHQPGSVHEMNAKLRECLRYYDALAPDVLGSSSGDKQHTSSSTHDETNDSASLELAAHRHHWPLRLLHLAAREWARRRESSVTTTHPTGCAAVARAPREMSSDASLIGNAEGYGSSTTVGRLERLFEPYESHDTPASQHAFHLPPLPCDPQWLIFIPLWQSLLQRCLVDRHELLHLRERALRGLALRCRHLTQQCKPQPVSSPSTSSLVECSAACGRLTSCTMCHFFTVFAPQSGAWRWNAHVGWLGFEGVLRCLLRPDACTVTKEDTSERPVRTKANTLTVKSAKEVDNYMSSDRHAVSRPFIDPALRLTANDLTISVEELTDYLCRLGAPLPRGLLGNGQHHMLILARHQVQYVMRVLQRGVLELYLACTRSRIEEMHLRPNFRGLVLTCVQESGTEVRLCTPGQLAGYVYPTEGSSSSKKNAHTSQSTNRAELRYGPAALRIVAEAGYAEVMALVHFLRNQCSTAAQRGMVRNIPLYTAQQRQRLQPNADTTSTSSSALPTVRALLLSRAEEAVLLRILQCHPHALYLIGCGVQQLMLRVSDGQPLIQRSCGMVVEWDLKACYVGPELQHLRSPRRVVSTGHGILPFPSSLVAQVPDLADRIRRETMVAMMWHYYRSLSQCVAPDKLSSASSSHSPGANDAAMNTSTQHATTSHSVTPSCAFGPRTTLFPVDRAVAMYVLRHHPHYYTQLRGCGIAEVYVAADTTREVQRITKQRTTTTEEEEQSVSRHAEPAGAAERGMEEKNTTCDREEAAVAATAAEGQPTFVLERVCGRLIHVSSIELCYSARAPHDLLPPMVLAGVQDNTSVSSVVSEAEHKRGREW